ncbi:MAG: hypothetical protein RLZZ28_2463 [Bacteroidota bacterium]
MRITLLFLGCFGLQVTLFAQADWEKREARATAQKEAADKAAQNKQNEEKLLNEKRNIDNNPSKLLPGLHSTGFGSIVNAYPIVFIAPDSKPQDFMSLTNISKIKIIDARNDIEKVGFLPIGNDVQKSGYTCVGIQLKKNLIPWLSEQFIQNGFQTDSNNNRQLVLVAQKFWFSNGATNLYESFKPKLLTTLHYSFDLYSSVSIGYYPQKKIAGSITTLFNSGKAYDYLIDSFLCVLRKEILAIDFIPKETENNWQSPVDFNDHYSSTIKKLSQLVNVPRGIYATYEDFLNKKLQCDSVEIVRRYSNYDRTTPFAQLLSGFNNGVHENTLKSWGYFDGASIYLNTGNGFFIRLINTNGKYEFFHIKNIQHERIKEDVLSGISIGNTSYKLIRDYTKAFGLTYQLDIFSGMLY